MADLAPGQKWAASLVVSRVRAAGIEENRERHEETRDKGASRRQGKEAHGGVVDGTASRVVKTLTDDKKRKTPVKKRRGTNCHAVVDAGSAAEGGASIGPAGTRARSPYATQRRTATPPGQGDAWAEEPSSRLPAPLNGQARTSGSHHSLSMSPPPRTMWSWAMRPWGPLRAAPEEGDGRFVTEDVVYRARRPLRAGPHLAGTRAGGGREPYSDEEDFELEDGHLRVCWLSGEEEVEDAADLRVMDRALMHGDIVARAADRSDRVRLPGRSSGALGRGTLWVMHLTVDLEADQRRVSGVPSHTSATCGSSLARHVVNATPELLIFKDEKQNLFVDEDQIPFYPGQSVRATSSFVFRHSKWVQGS
eukprot:jgi/Tetstr1/429050/TSEL_019015.t1